MVIRQYGISIGVDENIMDYSEFISKLEKSFRTLIILESIAIALIIIVVVLLFVFHTKIYAGVLKDLAKAEGISISKVAYNIIINIVRIGLMVFAVIISIDVYRLYNDKVEYKNGSYTIIVGEVVDYSYGRMINGRNVYYNPYFEIEGEEDLIKIKVPNTEMNKNYEVVYGRNSKIGVIIREITDEELD